MESMSIYLKYEIPKNIHTLEGRNLLTNPIGASNSIRMEMNEKYVCSLLQYVKKPKK